METSMGDERFMRRAIELALEPEFTSPNPRVGAVLVRDGRVIGAAAHEGPGHPHAESAALAVAGDARGAICYVTLEPCAHQGRTPPCAPALADAGVVKVVAAIEDPDPRVAGKGFGYLKNHGVELEVGVLAREARDVNVAYLHQRRTGRPLMTLKLALSLDGRVGARDGSSRWITGEQARAVVHARRQEVDAVVVGAGTVVADDPSLTVRNVSARRQPARVVVDANGRVDPSAAVFAAPGQVLIVTTDACPHERQTAWKEAGAEVVVIAARQGRVDLNALVDEFAQRSWLEVMCEGGAELATGLLRHDVVDRLELYYGGVLMGGDGLGVGDLGIGSLRDAPRFRLVTEERLGNDVRVVYEKESG